MAWVGSWLVALAIFAGLGLDLRAGQVTSIAAARSQVREAAKMLRRATPPALLVLRKPVSAASLPAGSIADLPESLRRSAGAAGAAFCQCPRREIAKQNHPTGDCEKWPGLEGAEAQEAVRELHPRRARPVTNSSAHESSRLPDRRRPDPAFARNLFSLCGRASRLLRLLLPGASAAPE